MKQLTRCVPLSHNFACLEERNHEPSSQHKVDDQEREPEGWKASLREEDKECRHETQLFKDTKRHDAPEFERPSCYRDKENLPCEGYSRE